MFGWDFIKALRPAKYNYTPEANQDKKVHFGVMAQDIEKYLKANSNEDFAILTKDDKDKFMVNYLELIAPMISTIQELQKRVEELENKPPFEAFLTTSTK